MQNKDKTGLSAHSLNIFRECERCFYLQIKYKISRPRGPIPSIATGIDSLIKDYFEYFRRKDKLPPFLEGKINGKLITNLKKTYYYDIENYNNYYLWGHLDEVIELPDGLFIPLDHKTRASLPSDEPHEAYKFQLGIYSLLLKKENKGQEVNYGYLIYYYPEKKLIDYEAEEIKNIINFNFEVKKVKLDEGKFNLDEIKETIIKAIECIETNKIPSSGQNCEFCQWIENTKIYYIESSEERKQEIDLLKDSNEKKQNSEEETTLVLPEEGKKKKEKKEEKYPDLFNFS
ncbi:MAG: PD-(D/E)XK nuclease family protein [bacterium]|nr:PD-(D/E)XK nuclease family protein [bacterium]MDW8163263.1 PD-(D/E)XK nuclease family protein [Candidatus Omnitrophota bacterium]